MGWWSMVVQGVALSRTHRRLRSKAEEWQPVQGKAATANS